MGSKIGPTATFHPNGHDVPQDAVDEGTDEGTEVRGPGPTPRRPPGPSTRPALVVVGIALALTVVGAVASGLAGGGGSTASRPMSAPVAKGAPLRAEASRGPLSAIEAFGLPPNDIVSSIGLPAGSAVSTGSALSSGIGLYDRSISFSVRASQQAVIGFFKVELPAGLWRTISEGPVAGTYEYRLLAQHPGSNGYEWEIGVTVMPERFVHPGSDAMAYGATPFTVRLYEVSFDE